MFCLTDGIRGILDPKKRTQLRDFCKTNPWKSLVIRHRPGAGGRRPHRNEIFNCQRSIGQPLSPAPIKRTRTRQNGQSSRRKASADRNRVIPPATRSPALLRENAVQEGPNGSSAVIMALREAGGPGGFAPKVRGFSRN